MSEQDLDKDAFAKFMGDGPWKDVSPLKAWIAALEYARTPKEPAKSDLEAAEKYAGVKNMGPGYQGQTSYQADSLVTLQNCRTRIADFLAGIAHRDAQVMELVRPLKALIAAGPAECPNCNEAKHLMERVETIVAKFESRGSNEKT